MYAALSTTASMVHNIAQRAAKGTSGPNIRECCGSEPTLSMTFFRFLAFEAATGTSVVLARTPPSSLE